MLIIRCPQCKENNTIMYHCFDEYLCAECLKTEKVALHIRQTIAYNKGRKERIKNEMRTFTK